MTSLKTKKLNRDAVSNGERNKTINTVKEIILTSGGSLINFTMFYGLAINLLLEFEQNFIIIYQFFYQFRILT